MRCEATFFGASLAALLAACGQPPSEPPKIADRDAHCDLASEKPEAITDPAAAEPVARQLRAWAQDARLDGPQDKDARFWAARLPCNDMIVAWLVGRSLCGSGGCSLFIWDASDQRLRRLGRVPVTWAPIRLIEGRSEGRPVLSAWTRGGGVEAGYERPFYFDGKEYPMTTGGEWDRRVASDVKGAVLIPELRAMEDGLPLYEGG